MERGTTTGEAGYHQMVLDTGIVRHVGVSGPKNTVIARDLPQAHTPKGSLSRNLSYMADVRAATGNGRIFHLPGAPRHIQSLRITFYLFQRVEMTQ